MTSEGKYQFERITREESEQLKGWRNCVHVMIHSSLPQPTHLFGNNKICIEKTILVSCLTCVLIILRF